MKSLCLLLLAALIGFAAGSTRRAITALPDYNGPALEQYSGYVTVDQANQRNLFYWHIKALVNPSTAPVVFWYQGGPGCSGLLGLMTENGPFQPNLKGGLDYREINWLKYVNMVWLEQPAGVGFSYSNNPLDYNTNDTRAAQDNYKFLEGFFQLFPELNNRDFWITGESYAGVYLPTLANLVLSNKTSSLYNNFKGLMAGNPVMDCASLTYNADQFNLLYWHGLVSYNNYNDWNSNNCNSQDSSSTCQAILQNAVKEIGKLDQELAFLDTPQPSLDPDMLYQDFCTGNGTLEFTKTVPGSRECSPLGNRVVTYFNRKDVQTAIGANPTTWVVCTNKINYTRSGASMIPLYRNFPNQKADFKVLVYSGDIDIMTVPFAMTAQCLYELRTTNSLVSPWQPWFVNGATAGYVETFSHYTFATLKGGGHEAPQYQPLNAINMFSRFLLKQNLTDAPEHAPIQGRWGSLKQSTMLRQLGIRI